MKLPKAVTAKGAVALFEEIYNPDHNPTIKASSLYEIKDPSGDYVAFSVAVAPSQTEGCPQLFHQLMDPDEFVSFVNDTTKAISRATERRGHAS